MAIYTFFSSFEWIFIITFFVCLLTQIVYYLTIYRRIIVLNKRVKKEQNDYTTEQKPVSVIVYACNDADNLEQYLPQILNQNYPNFEVIVVNDGSTDETKDLLTILESKYPHLYQTYIPEGAKNHSRRKLAMTVGVKAAKYDWILATEANCEILSMDWIASISRNFTSTTEIVLMYSNYAYPKNIKSVYRSLDNLFFSIRYLGMASLGKPFMGIRRNLAYKKELFFRNGGAYSGFLNLKDGDDDLFINRVSSKTNTRVEISKDSVTRANFYQFDKAWKIQKQGYGITSHFLQNRSAFLFGFESFSRYLFYASFFATIILGIQNWILYIIAGSFFLIRFLIQTVIINKVGNILGEKFYLFSIPLFDIIQPIIDYRYRLAGRFTKRR
ncbi:MAG: glycosyltransferase [Bacteroidales bacterium]|nr:glycosyltransferase [Bacteroidales bacterium]